MKSYYNLNMTKWKSMWNFKDVSILHLHGKSLHLP